jgi:ABC-type uncharacterized transport system YnjBCD ATPase subunit
VARFQHTKLLVHCRDGVAVADARYIALTSCATLFDCVMATGGEKARVALSIFVLVPHNLLILDEVSHLTHDA